MSWWCRKVENKIRFGVSCDDASELMKQLTWLGFWGEVQKPYLWASKRTKSSFEIKNFGLASAKRAWFWGLRADLEPELGRNDGYLSQQINSRCPRPLQCEYIIRVWQNRWAREAVTKTASGRFPLRFSSCCSSCKNQLLIRSSVNKFLLFSSASKVAFGLL